MSLSHLAQLMHFRKDKIAKNWNKNIFKASHRFDYSNKDTAQCEVWWIWRHDVQQNCLNCDTQWKWQYQHSVLFSWVSRFLMLYWESWRRHCQFDFRVILRLFSTKAQHHLQTGFYHKFYNVKSSLNDIIDNYRFAQLFILVFKQIVIYHFYLILIASWLASCSDGETVPLNFFRQ